MILERQYSKLQHCLPVHQADIVLDEKNGITLLTYDEIQQVKNLNSIKDKLVALSLQFQQCWIIIHPKNRSSNQWVVYLLYCMLFSNVVHSWFPKAFLAFDWSVCRVKLPHCVSCMNDWKNGIQPLCLSTSCIIFCPPNYTISAVPVTSSDIGYKPPLLHWRFFSQILRSLVDIQVIFQSPSIRNQWLSWQRMLHNHKKS